MVLKSKIFAGFVSLGIALALVPLLSAFEAHIINVTAQIENGCLNKIDDIDFGTTFPQEKLDKEFDVELSQSFLASVEHDALSYHIVQKPKCWNGNEEEPTFGQVTEENNEFVCVDDGFTILPVLCPYLSKHEISTDGTDNGGENDGPGISAFHGLPGSWTINTSSSTIVDGKLIKSLEDIADRWNIDLKVPCFEGYCAQDWADFVHGINPDVNPDDYTQPIENEHKLFGCDLWLEITGKPTSTTGCLGKIDLMLVLDRSGSINSTELTTLKNAANSFVTALAPQADGVHVGQTSFSTTGTLDLHLTSNEADAHTAVNALVAGGFTNLLSGIQLANGELDNPGDGHDRDDTEAPDVMVIITDGAPNRPLPSITADDLAIAAADAARADGIEIFVVGVGVTASTETYLKTEIADDASHYFAAVDFSALEAILVALADCPK